MTKEDGLKDGGKRADRHNSFARQIGVEGLIMEILSHIHGTQFTCLMKMCCMKTADCEDEELNA